MGIGAHFSHPIPPRCDTLTSTQTAAPAPPHATEAPPGTYRRSHHYPELDALRGLAAFVVVLSHFGKLWEPASIPPRLQLLFGLILAPLFNAASAVMLFFLLSGFVLSLPYRTGTELRYPVFLLRRLARIYLPYLGALALALLADWRLHHPMQVSRWFSQTWTAPLTPALLLQHLLLIGNYDTAQINTAFWSLAVEMRLSILFPLFCVPLMRLRARFVPLWFLGLLLFYTADLRLLQHRLSPVSFTNLSEMLFATLSFSAGIVLARWFTPAKALWDRSGTPLRIAFTLLAFVLFEWSGLLTRVHLFSLTGPLAIAGGCGLLVTALCSRRAGRLLNHRLPAWMGRVSYSLYLVHATVLFALVHLFFGRLTRLQLLAPYLLLALAAAALFFVAVEKPCIQLSRSIGRHVRLPNAAPVAPIA